MAGEDVINQLPSWGMNMTADSLQKLFPEPNGRHGGNSKLPVDSL